MSTVVVEKLDDSGRLIWSYPAQVLERGANHVKLQARFDKDTVDLGFVALERGDRFVEYYYRDHWYNVFAVYDRRDDALKGWYCNICRPSELGETAVRYADLALDLWVAPSGQMTILDQDEFDELALSDLERHQAIAALAELQSLAEEQTLPR
jgi:predicted RNA-binding protein associated with RNAse of E/G family